ncbi:hypothetical protein U5903_18545 [Cereibacter johrii]|uniref:hypothetical protein n=1 Tax=Cereibacter johrii TaxID=445629 RepID=UPI002B257B0D|nr:hypothetical protein [Cereibacter johrii]MEA5162784.1 hypothetical protein [Cereibacter johrii]
MTLPGKPRGLLLAAAFAAGTAQAGGLSGTLDHEGGTALPKGVIEISAGSAAPLRLESDGAARTMAFALPDTPAGTEVEARLLRADGWLLARGSARLEPGAPLRITLYTALY